MCQIITMCNFIVSFLQVIFKPQFDASEPTEPKNMPAEVEPADTMLGCKFNIDIYVLD